MNTTELIFTSILKAFLAVTGAVGLLFSTEKVIIDVNPPFIVAVIICAGIFAYGLYSLIKDFPKLYRAVVG